MQTKFFTKARAFGVVVSIETNSPLLFPLIHDQLPDFPVEPESTSPDLLYRVLVNAQGTSIVVLRDRRTVATTTDLALASSYLVNDLQSALGRTASGWTFIHAGVVAISGRALLLPGRSGAGKSTLVTALLRLGAAYGSDEFAVIDPTGSVYPYSRQIVLRNPSSASISRLGEDSIGAARAADALPVDAVVFTHYRPGPDVALRRMSRGQLLLSLLEHTVSARGRPIETLSALHAVARHAVAFHGERGEADAAADVLIQCAEAGWQQVPALLTA